MNYFIDIPSFSRFYGVNDKDDEKPPPDLKKTGIPIEERVIKKGIRRKQTDETSVTLTADESMARKEKSSWPDWQFWKRSDGSSGPFGAFRKSTKSTGQSGGFTFRKDIDDTVKVNKSEVSSEHTSSNSGKNVGQKTNGNKSRKSEAVQRSKPEKDDPLASYKESNGLKHVVINMKKVEKMAARKDKCQSPGGDVSVNIMEEKYVKNGQTGYIGTNRNDQRGVKVAQSSLGQKVVSQQPSGTKKTPSINCPRLPVTSRKPEGNIDEKPDGELQDLSGMNARKNAVENGSCKTIKPTSVIPVPRLNPKQVAEKKQNESKPNETTTAKTGACREQGKLHNALKKVPGTAKPVNGNITPAQNVSEPVRAALEVSSPKVDESNSARKVENNQTEPLAKPEYNVTKRHTSQKASRRYNVLHHGKVRTNISQKPTGVESARSQKAVRCPNEKRVEKSKEENSDRVSSETVSPRKPNNGTDVQVKARAMKDASTSTPSPTARVDVEVQVPCEEENEGLSSADSDSVDETMSLLKKRPWDTERVLKMQVLLDEKQVVIGRLKEAGRKQREELKASRKRCANFEKIINQANMEGKPQLVIQINDLTEIKNELVEEISRLTVDIERERTNVKTLKNELVELKGQLNSARKRNANLGGQ